VVPGTIGTFAFFIKSRAEVFPPNAFIAETGGPMKVIPFETVASTKSGFQRGNHNQDGWHHIVPFWQHR